MKFEDFWKPKEREPKNSRALGSVIYDHRPLQLNDDDYQRVCQLPKRKGANFRDLPGVRVRSDNKVEWDPDVERVKLPSGKPLVPDYAMSFVGGSSTKPFGRLWWDETVPTVVTRAEPHNQTIIHPQQNRVLTIRENARLHGFPDYYKLTGPIKERYIQVGNAVAVPVARALGYSLAMAMKGSSDGKPLMSLPENFHGVLKGQKGNLGSSLDADERMKQKIEEMEERMQQRMHEKLNEQKDAMEQNITVNVIARLQRLNPDLRLDPDMLRFSARSPVDASSAQQAAVQPNNRPSAGKNTQGQYVPNVIHLLLFHLLLLPCLGFCI
ncbi:dna (cytosine-5)-methyltransferase 1 [Nicotiana attenuata]|uniref:DNA (cytosine-5-)-methyltransferase n=1 Tax=Nicotiana attenuata TaxID=49451 RepID=A0A314LBW1_NICAT|nr:dna (cytosine-5)-methyltransferase 1 [Nicotiana attenuata]